MAKVQKNTTSMPTLKFVLSKNKANSEIGIIKVCVYFNKKQSHLRSTGIKLIGGERWDTKTKTVVGNDHKTAELTKLQTELNDIFYTRKNMGKTDTARDLLLFVFKKMEWTTAPKKLIELMQEYEAYRQPEVEAKKLHPKTFERLGKFRRVTSEFLMFKYKLQDIEIKDIKPAIAQEFEQFLILRKKYADVSIAKTMRHLKCILKYAMSYEYVDRNVLEHKKWQVEHKPINYLTTDELQRIEALTLLPHLDTIRDLFVFMSWTGFCFCDGEELSPKHLLTGTDGIVYIKKKRKKNGNDQLVPVNVRAMEIIDKYRNLSPLTGKLLPFCSLQELNKQLKVIAAAANITRVNVSTHLGRKTFATWLRGQGLSIETIAVILGHASHETTRKFYAATTEASAINEVARLLLTEPKKITVY
jgi:integrase